MNPESPPEESRSDAAAGAMKAGRAPAGTPVWLSWAAVAGLVLLAAFLVQEYLVTRSEIAALRMQGAMAGLEVRSLQNQLEAERILNAQRLAQSSARNGGAGDLGRLQIFPMQSPVSAGASGVVLWDSDRQEGLLVTFGVPVPAPNCALRLWMVDPRRPDPVQGGVLPASAAAAEARIPFRPEKPVSSVTKFFVSIDVPGGGTQAAGPVVMSSQ
jgi:hypothetical protein